jgi:hypothetical protein
MLTKITLIIINVRFSYRAWRQRNGISVAAARYKKKKRYVRVQQPFYRYSKAVQAIGYCVVLASILCKHPSTRCCLRPWIPRPVRIPTLSQRRVILDGPAWPLTHGYRESCHDCGLRVLQRKIWFWSRHSTGTFKHESGENDKCTVQKKKKKWKWWNDDNLYTW